jgi:hypothetical protein
MKFCQTLKLQAYTLVEGTSESLRNIKLLSVGELKELRNKTVACLKISSETYKNFESQDNAIFCSRINPVTYVCETCALYCLHEGRCN